MPAEVPREPGIVPHRHRKPAGAIGRLQQHPVMMTVLLETPRRAESGRAGSENDDSHRQVTTCVTSTALLTDYLRVLVRPLPFDTARRRAGSDAESAYGSTFSSRASRSASALMPPSASSFSVWSAFFSSARVCSSNWSASVCPIMRAYSHTAPYDAIS